MALLPDRARSHTKSHSENVFVLCKNSYSRYKYHNYWRQAICSAWPCRVRIIGDVVKKCRWSITAYTHSKDILFQNSEKEKNTIRLPQSRSLCCMLSFVGLLTHGHSFLIFEFLKKKQTFPKHHREEYWIFIYGFCSAECAPNKDS